MKKLYTIFLVTAFAALFVACEGLNTLPEFEPEESFASFPTASFALNEDEGQLKIPVEIASIQPVETVVSYKIIDGTAKAGVDFKDTNASAVLKFDGTTRKQEIVLEILPHLGEYTGDRSFSLELVSATGLKLSMEKTCNVIVYDIDHPLSSILGTYTGEAEDVGGPVTWTLSLTKDPKDVTVVWCNAICPLMLSSGITRGVYANVTLDEESGKYTLAFPCGQSVADDFNGNGELILCECYIDGGYYIDDTSTLIFTQTATGFESLFGMGLVNDYLYYNGFLLGDRTEAGLKVVWTKN